MNCILAILLSLKSVRLLQTIGIQLPHWIINALEIVNIKYFNFITNEVVNISIAILFGSVGLYNICLSIYPYYQLSKLQNWISECHETSSNEEIEIISSIKFFYSKSVQVLSLNLKLFVLGFAFVLNSYIAFIDSRILGYSTFKYTIESGAVYFYSYPISLLLSNFIILDTIQYLINFNLSKLQSIDKAVEILEKAISDRILYNRMISQGSYTEDMIVFESLVELSSSIYTAKNGTLKLDSIYHLPPHSLTFSKKVGESELLQIKQSFMKIHQCVASSTQSVTIGRQMIDNQAIENPQKQSIFSYSFLSRLNLTQLFSWIFKWRGRRITSGGMTTSQDDLSNKLNGSKSIKPTIPSLKLGINAKDTRITNSTCLKQIRKHARAISWKIKFNTYYLRILHVLNVMSLLSYLTYFAITSNVFHVYLLVTYIASYWSKITTHISSSQIILYLERITGLSYKIFLPRIYSYGSRLYNLTQSSRIISQSLPASMKNQYSIASTSVRDLKIPLPVTKWDLKLIADFATNPNMYLKSGNVQFIAYMCFLVYHGVVVMESTLVLVVSLLDFAHSVCRLLYKMFTQIRKTRLKTKVS